MRWNGSVRFFACLVAAILVVVQVGSTGARGEDSSGEQEALRLARESGAPVVVSSLTSETVQVTALPDGTLRADVSLEPERVGEGSGWASVDRSLVARSGRLSARRGVSASSVSDGGSEPLVRVEEGGQFFELRWTRPLPVPGVTGDTAVYGSVLPGVDLVAVSGPRGFGTYWVVRDAQAVAGLDAEALTFSWRASAGLSLRVVGAELQVVDGSGRVVFGSSGLAVWDSDGIPAGLRGSKDLVRRSGDSRRQPVSATVSGDRLVLGVDPAYWRQPGLVFPVVVDPSVTRSQSSWLMVWSDGQRFWNNATENARVGYDGWSGFKVSRVFYQFSLSGLGGRYVKSASLTARQVHSPGFACAPATDANSVDVYRTSALGSSMSWSGQPSWIQKLDSDVQVSGNSQTCHGIDQKWDVTAGVASQVSAGAGSVTLGLRSANESDRMGWRQYDNTSAAYAGYPKLSIVFYGVPGTPSGLVVGDPAAPGVDRGGWSTSGRLWLGVSVAPESVPGDATRDASVNGLFRVTNVATGVQVWPVVGTRRTSAEVSSVVYPASGAPVLPDGRYRVSANACSQDSGAWRCSAATGERVVTVDTRAPAPPVVENLTIDQVPSDVFGVNESWQTRVRLAGDAVGFTYLYDTGQSGRVVGEHVHIGSGGTPGRRWLQVQAFDAAGNLSAPVRVWVKVLGVDPQMVSHRYRMEPGPLVGGVVSVLDEGPAERLVLDRGNLATAGMFVADAGSACAPAGNTVFAPGGAGGVYVRGQGSSLMTNSPFSATVWVKASAADVDVAAAGGEVNYVWGIGPMVGGVRARTVWVTLFGDKQADGSTVVRWRADVDGTRLVSREVVTRPDPDMGVGEVWTPIGVSKDSARNVRLFVGDGEPVVAATPGWGTNTEWLGVGAVSSTTSVRSFSGMVDGLIFYDGALVDKSEFVAAVNQPGSC